MRRFRRLLLATGAAMRRALILLLCWNAVSAAAQESVVRDGVSFETDRFKGTSSISSRAVRLPPDNYGVGPQIRMMFSQQMARDSSKALYVFVAYQGRDWMFIPGGESLYFLLDNAPVAVSTPDGSSQYREVLPRGVSEVSPYPVDEGLLLRLLRAQRVEVKVVGQKFELERAFNDDIRKRLRAFLRAIGTADSLLSTPGSAPGSGAALPARSEVMR